MTLSAFITDRTLQNLQHIELRIPLGMGKHGSGWVWAELAKRFITVLQRKNKFKTLKVVILVYNRADATLWSFGEGKHLKNIDTAVSSTSAFSSLHR